MNSLNIAERIPFEKQSLSYFESRKNKIDKEIFSSLHCFVKETTQFNAKEFKIAQASLDHARLHCLYVVVLRISNFIIKVFNKNYFKIDHLLNTNQIANFITRKYSEILSPQLIKYTSLKDFTFVEKHEFSDQILLGMYHLQKYHYNQMLGILSKFKQDLKGSKSKFAAIEIFRALPWYIQSTLEELVMQRYKIRIEDNPKILRETTVKKFSIFSQLEKALQDQIHSYSGLTTISRSQEEKTKLILSIQTYDHVFEKMSYDVDLSDSLDIYDTSIQRIAKKIPTSVLDKPISVTMVGVEYAEIFSHGGLGEAIEGLSKGLKKQNPKNRVKLIFPKYSHIPDKEIQKGFKNPKFHTSSTGKKYAVYFQKIGGVECYFIEDPSFILDKENPNPYGPDFATASKRFSTFSSLAADLIHEQKDTDIIHLHDWHVVGIGLKLKKDHEKEWIEGKIPPIFFTFHNNHRASQGRLVMGPYNYDPLIKGYQDAGILEKNENLFVLGLNMMDAGSTVSERFSFETQQLPFGKGASFAVKEAAKVGKLSGIINGLSTMRHNPEIDHTLLHWKDIETGESINLSYGPKHPDILGQKKKCGEQLQKYVKKYFPEAQIDFSKPIISYIGRFDSFQKFGKNDLDEGIKTTLQNGGQFICMGFGEDPKAKQILDDLQKRYPKGVLFIRDKKDKNGKLYYQHGDKERPPIGALIRAISDFLFIPSKYEPCGLVQLEGWQFGSLAIGSETGGLADTIIPPEVDRKDFNGFLFQRHGDENKTPSQIIRRALKFWKNQDAGQKNRIIKRVMENAKKYHWNSPLKGSTPAEKYRIAYENARVFSQCRVEKSTRHYDMLEAFTSRIPVQKTTKKSSEKSFLEENYLYHYYVKKMDSEALHELYIQLPEEVKGNMPYPYGANVNYSQYQKYGAFFQEDKSTSIAVYAPNASNVEVVLFNDDESIQKKYAMKKDAHGDWAALIHEIRPGQKYQFHIDGQTKIDPYGRFHVPSKDPTKPPFSVVVNSKHNWTDKKWMDKQKHLAGQSQPMSIYEVYPMAWKKHSDGRALNYREFAKELVKHCEDFGFTHVELMGSLEHPNELSWGYQVSGYFAPTSRMGSVDDFKYMIDYLHKHNIGVILDWVPAHFAKDAFALSNFDGSPLYEASGLLHQFSIRNLAYNYGAKHFDFGKKQVREFLISSAVYWLKEMHIDGLRLDCLSSILYSSNKDPANLFIRDLNAIIHTVCNGSINIAEDYSGNGGTTFPFFKEGLSFDRKWHTGWVKKILGYLALPIQSRKEWYEIIEEAVMSDNFHRQVMCFSHDEVKYDHDLRQNLKTLINKTPDLTNADKKHANLRTLLSFVMCLPGKKLQFMGNEYGNEITWNSYIKKNIGVLTDINTKDAKKQGLQRMMKALHDIYKTKKAFYEFDDNGNDIEWIADPRRNIHAYRRKSTDGSSFVCLHNFLDEGTKEFTVVVKKAPRKKIALEEIFSSDNDLFYGKGYLNKEIKIINENKKEIQYKVNVPPLSTIIIKEKE